MHDRRHDPRGGERHRVRDRLEHGEPAGGPVTALRAATFPELAQPVSLDLATTAPLTLLVNDGTGQASAVWPLPAGFANVTVWIQSFANGPQPMRVSPVSGGVLR